MERDIVILATSEKYGNFCVAGVDVNTGQWIRPYSRFKDIAGAVPLEHITYENGERAKIFDVVRINFNEHCNNIVQPENIYYDHSHKWKYIDKLTLYKTVLIHDFDYRDKIFFNTERRLTQPEIDSVLKKESLLMLYVTNIDVVVEFSKYDNQRKFRLNFDCEGQHYIRFSIGDPIIRQLYCYKPPGTYRFYDKAIIVFSLTDKFKDDRYYKMAAQFIVWR